MHTDDCLVSMLSVFHLQDNSTMLIEASRGGHTNVATILLRQPRDTSPLDTPSCSPLGSRHSILEHTPTPQEGGKPPVANTPQDGKLNSAAKSKERGVAGAARGQWYTGSGEEEEGGGQEHVTRLGKSLLKSANSLDVGDAKRQKIADGATLPAVDLLQCGLEPSVGSGTSPEKVKGTPQDGHSLRYANANSLNQFNASEKASEGSGSVSVPENSQLTPDEIINDIIQGHMTADDIMDGHVTAEEIVARYRLSSQKPLHCPGKPQENSVQLASLPMENVPEVFSSGNFSKQVPLPLLTNMKIQAPPTSTKNATKNATSADPTVSCDSHATSQSAELSTAECNSLNSAPVRGPSTTTYASPTTSSSQTCNDHTLANMNLKRLIPHLEVLADLLQNPTSLETQYLAALTAKSQMFPGFPPGSGVGGSVPDGVDMGTLPNNLESLAAIAAHFGHVDPGPPHMASAFEALAAIASHNLAEDKSNLSSVDISNLFTSADFAKILPTLAALEVQGGLGFTDEGGGVPMDGPELRPDGCAHPVPKRSHSLANNSFLLDGNFRIDIPPPGEVDAGGEEGPVGEEGNQLPSGIPSGYNGPLEQESFPSSDDDDDDDEEGEEEEDGDLEDEESGMAFAELEIVIGHLLT